MREILNVSIGGTAQQLAQALTSARSMLNAWVSDVRNTVYRKLRWYLSGAVSVGLIQRGLASVREWERRAMRRDTEAIATGVDAQLRHSLEQWQKVAGLSDSATSLMLERFRELGSPAQTFRDYLQDALDVLLKIDDPMQRIVESARRLGVVLSQEQLQSLRNLMPGAEVGVSGTASMFAHTIGPVLNRTLLRFPEAFMAGLRNLYQFIFGPYREAAESAQAAAAMEQRLAIATEVRRAAQRKAAEEQRRSDKSLGDAYIERLEAEKQLELQAGKFEKVIRIIDDQIGAIMRLMPGERNRTLQLQLEADLLKLIGERQQVVNQGRDAEARLQKERQGELERQQQIEDRLQRRRQRIADVEFQMQQARESRIAAMAPSLRMLAWPFTFMGRMHLSPAAALARQMLWLERAIPVAWAMGARQAAEPLINRWEQIRAILQRSGFLPEDDAMKTLLREQEKARLALERVAEAARSGRLAVEVELAE